MKNRILVSIIIFFVITSCKHPEESHTDVCATIELQETVQYNDLVQNIQENFISATTEEPNVLGALDRNKNGYFHVRFQFNMSKLIDYAIRFQDETAIQAYVNNLDYSFSYQNAEGDFQFIPPDDVLASPDYHPPTESDLVSGVAFFAYSLGISLNSFEQSEWVANSTSLTPLKQHITTLIPNIENTLSYLKNNVELLSTADAEVPNRLFFNAIAFYNLGKYLHDSEAENIGIQFAQEALLQRNFEEGYFIENGGWDSSYNGVVIKLGFELFTLLDSTVDEQLKNEIAMPLSCATIWQKSRVLPTGEISTEGNTRVYPGGEAFLGNEKQVDALKTAWAFFYMGTLSNDPEFEELGVRVLEYYY